MTVPSVQLKHWAGIEGRLIARAVHRPITLPPLFTELFDMPHCEGTGKEGPKERARVKSSFRCEKTMVLLAQIVKLII